MWEGLKQNSLLYTYQKNEGYSRHKENYMHGKFSESGYFLGLAADLFQGELPCRNMVAVLANPLLLMDVLFGVAFIIACTVVKEKSYEI